MLVDELLNWVNGNGVVVGLLTFLLGTLFGHWFAIHRDDRTRRIAAFGEVRKKITGTNGAVRISAADADAVLTECVWWRREGLRRAIDRCNQAADGYYPSKDAWGSPLSSPESEAAMRAAVSNLAGHLRRT